MKPQEDEVIKVFKGLAVAAARAKDLATQFGRQELLGDLPRRQQDTVRQQLLDIKADVETVLRILTHSGK